MIININPSVSVKVTVTFEDPKWVATVERTDAHGSATARVEFAAEPSEAEVQAFVTEHYDSLKFVTPAQATALKGQEALKRLLEKRQHQNAIASRLNQPGGKQKASGKANKQQDRHRGVR